MFQPGQSGNPSGKPKGCVGGRSRALKVLDDMLVQEENLAALETALKAELHKNPIRFFRTIVMPLLPHDARIEVQSAPQVMVWESLVSVIENDRSKHDRITSEPGREATPTLASPE